MPIFHDVEQGSDAWLKLRMGKPTSSEFEKIVTPKGAFSKSSRGYACYLAAEYCLQRQLTNLDHIQHISDGKELEPQAVATYTFVEGIDTKKIGFVTTNDGLIGASPDRLLVGINGGLEVKCPVPATFIKYWSEGFGDDYWCQIMGQMWVCEFEFVDRYAFNPEFPKQVCERVYRDEPFIKTLSQGVGEFADKLQVLIHKIKSSGMFQDKPDFTTAHQAAYEGIAA
jgi:hypothetical protein